jgi:peptidoglycan/xylan/chitin deacetylase (PgdA/CDA1 family)
MGCQKMNFLRAIFALILLLPFHASADSVAIPVASVAARDVMVDASATAMLSIASATASSTAGIRGGEQVLAAICYHRFGIETRLDPYRISPLRLAGQLRWLRANGWTSVSLTQVAAALDGDMQALPQKGVLLSVDDGYKAGELCAPVFKRYGFHAVYFVVPSMLGHSGFLSYQDLRELESYGQEVASHTLSHPDLAKVPEGMDPLAYARWVDRELRESKRLLEQALGHPVDALAWPYGAYNSTVAAAALRVGYRQLWSVSGGLNSVQGLDRARLRRIVLQGLPPLKSFRRRLRSRPLLGPVDCIADGDLFYRSQLPLGLSVPQGIEAALDGRPLALNGTGNLVLTETVGDGFHFLNLAGKAGGRTTSFLFQVAPDDWKPYFDALASDVSLTASP